ncbi:MAG: N-acetylmuramoyl-L-alanine amidase [Acidobacteriota bacterium]
MTKAPQENSEQRPAMSRSHTASFLVAVALLLVAGFSAADLSARGFPASGLPRPAIAPASGPPVAASASQEGLRVVVLDPGHGGSELGAVGPTGVTEKEVALDIVRRLADLIQERLGLQVRLTRDGDFDVDLKSRAEQANNLKADVFLSIHANAYRGKGVRGAETFFLSDKATDDDAHRLAALENDALDLQSAAAGDSDLQLLLWDMAQTLHLRESSVLAEMIQQHLNHLAGTGDRGVKQAPFRVLRGANMPAVLVEVGFLSNPDEEALLADPDYRQQVAAALFASLDGYRRRQALISVGSHQR